MTTYDTIESAPETFANMDEALVGILVKLLGRGERFAPRGLETREILGHTFRLANPRARRITLPSRQWKESLAIGEFCWHLSQSDSLDFISYYTPTWKQFAEDGRRITSSCYGKRIFGRGNDSQWHRARKALAHDQITRRAILTLVDTDADLTTAKDVSCVTAIQFLLRDNQLNCITTMRSCDVIWGLCYDVYFCTMLQEVMAAELGVDIGWYQHSSGSLHLYEQFADMARQIVNDGLVISAAPMAALSDFDRLPEFLGVERALRENRVDAATRLEALPDYWRSLAAPLHRLQALRARQRVDLAE